MKRYLIGAMLGLLAGAILYFVQPVKWKAQALVRVGQTSQNQNQNSFPIEPLPTVVERLKSRAFVEAVAKRAKKNEVVALINIEEKAGMTIQPTKNSDSIVITIVDGSSELARTTTDAVVNELIFKHNVILQTYQNDIIKELSKLDAEADALSKRIVMATEAMRIPNCNFSEGRGAVAGFFIMMLQRDLEFKLNRSSLLREAISSVNNRSTSLLEPVSISERRLFSSLWRASLLGALSGILLSAIWIRWGK